MKYCEHLIQHKFVEINSIYVTKIIQDSMPLYLDHLNNGKTFPMNESIEIDNYLYYHYVVNQKVNSILDSIERLEQCLIFLEEFPQPRIYEKKNIYQENWSKYHYSNFVVTYNSILDLSLLLSNSVHQLNIPERYCDIRKMKKHKSMKNTKTISVLEEIFLLSNQYWIERNRYVHKGVYPDINSLNNSENLVLLEVYNSQRRHGRKFFPDEIVDQNYKNEMKLAINQLDGKIEIIVRSITKLFDSFLPFYN